MAWALSVAIAQSYCPREMYFYLGLLFCPQIILPELYFYVLYQLRIMCCVDFYRRQRWHCYDTKWKRRQNKQKNERIDKEWSKKATQLKSQSKISSWSRKEKCNGVEKSVEKFQVSWSRSTWSMSDINFYQGQNHRKFA